MHQKIAGRSFVALGLSLCLQACTDGFARDATQFEQASNKTQTVDEPSGFVVAADPETAIPGAYIVVLAQPGGIVGDPAGIADRVRDIRATIDDLVEFYGGTVQFRYDYAIAGYAVSDLSEETARMMSHDSRIWYVEQDVYGVGAQTLRPTGINTGLDRLDQRNLPVDSLIYTPYFGWGHMYVVDSGIDPNSLEFVGFWGQGKSCDPFTSEPWEDWDGHGTAVASTIAGLTTGVSPYLHLHSVRIQLLSGLGGSASAGVCGLNWIGGNVERPAMVNISWRWNAFAIRDAIDALTAYNILVIKAAGNDNADAFTVRENRAVDAVVVGGIVVGNTSVLDNRWNLSNYGPDVDIFAPYAGETAVAGSPSSTTWTASGTSLSSGYTSGVAAQIWEELIVGNPTTSASEVRDSLIARATVGVIESSTIGTGSPNRLVYIYPAR